MSIKPLHQQSIGELAAGLRNGEFSSADLTQHFLPIIFTVSYRTENGFKSGYVVIDP